MKEVSDIVAAYTAGMIDGEGSIQANTKKVRGAISRYWCLSVHVTSCYYPAIEWLRDQWDIGTITEYQGRDGRQKAYVWRVYSKNVERLLLRVLPYLIIKRELADLALEFRQYIQINHGKGLPRIRITPEIAAKRQSIGEKMRIINRQRGKARIDNHLTVAK